MALQESSYYHKWGTLGKVCFSLYNNFIYFFRKLYIDEDTFSWWVRIITLLLSEKTLERITWVEFQWMATKPRSIGVNSPERPPLGGAAPRCMCFYIYTSTRPGSEHSLRPSSHLPSLNLLISGPCSSNHPTARDVILGGSRVLDCQQSAEPIY